MNNIYAAENTVAREDLAALIARLSDAQLSQPMPAGRLVYAAMRADLAGLETQRASPQDGC